MLCKLDYSTATKLGILEEWSDGEVERALNGAVLEPEVVKVVKMGEALVVGVVTEWKE